jgi:hypothetical protein
VVSASQLTHRGLTVPYITPWSGESIHIPTLVRAGSGLEHRLGYADESLYDRDWQGALWARHRLARGNGRPQFDGVHTLRQRRCMNDLLCQVCACRAQTDDGEATLFILRNDGRRIEEGERTTAPPVCSQHALEAAVHCPHLRAGHVVVRVQRVQSWGVAGLRHHPATLEALPLEANQQLSQVSYEDPQIHWIVASRQVVTLHDCTAVDVPA